MSDRVVCAPVSVLTASGLAPTARLLWLQLHTHTGPVTLARLGATTGLAKGTIRQGLAQLEARGWYSPAHGPVQPADLGPAPIACFPESLLRSPRLSHRAKLLYGTLQSLPGFAEKFGEFTYAGLSSTAQVSAWAARQLIRSLADEGWVHVTRAGKPATVRVTLHTPEQDRIRADISLAQHRLHVAGYSGESIMRGFLSLLIAADEYEDNARPGWLVNPLTRERLELDRYYYGLEAAFEYHGAQHFHVTPQYPDPRELAERKARDLMKEALCARRRLPLVIITRGDLRLNKMKQKVGAVLPLRDLRGYEELINLLEEEAQKNRSS